MIRPFASCKKSVLHPSPPTRMAYAGSSTSAHEGGGETRQDVNLLVATQAHTSGLFNRCPVDGDWRAVCTPSAAKRRLFCGVTLAQLSLIPPCLHVSTFHTLLLVFGVLREADVRHGLVPDPRRNGRLPGVPDSGKLIRHRGGDNRSPPAHRSQVLQDM